VTIIEAHRDLEQLVLTRHELAFQGRRREGSGPGWSIRASGWSLSGSRLDSFIRTHQRRVTGTVRLKLYKGGLRVVGRSFEELALQGEALLDPTRKGSNVRPVVGGRVHRALGLAVGGCRQTGRRR